MGNANPAHRIFAVSYLEMHFTSIKTLVSNRKLCMDFLISSTAKRNQSLKDNPLTPSRGRKCTAKQISFSAKKLCWIQIYVHKKRKQIPGSPSLSIVTDATRDNNSSQLRAGPCITKWLVYYGLEAPALVGFYLKVKKVMGYLAPAQLRSRLGLRSLQCHLHSTEDVPVLIRWQHTGVTPMKQSGLLEFASNKEEMFNSLTYFGLDTLRWDFFVYANNLIESMRLW